MMVGSKKRKFGTLLSAAALAFGVTIATPARSQDFSFGPTITTQDLLSSRLFVMSGRALSGGGELKPDQLTRAAILMEIALKTSPKDADLWRARAELAEVAKERKSLIEALTAYSRLVPADDAAQLKLILASLETIQTNDERLKVVERLLEPAQSERLSPALRSRLSSYAAAAAQQLGDTQRFASHLIAATKLDESNAEAARMTYELALSSNASPSDMGVAVMGVVRASPLDSKARALFAQLLLSQAAYARAAEQFAAARVVAMSPLTPNDLDAFVPGWIVSLAASGKPEEALAVLKQIDESLVAAAAQAAAQAAKDETKSQPVPQLKLPLDLQLLRLGILTQTGDAPAAESAFARIRAELRRKLVDGDAESGVDLAWISLLFDRDLEEVPTLLKAAANKGAIAQPVLQRIQGWDALRHDRKDEARKLLGPLADFDAFAAIGLARTFERADDSARVALLNKALAISPATLSGLVAAAELSASGEKVHPLPAGEEMSKKLENWSKPLLSPSPTENPLTVMSLVVEPKEYDFLQPMTLKVSMRNSTDVPISMGPGGTVPSRLGVFVSPRRLGTSMGELPPIVADINRRLRIEPLQSFESSVRLDRSSLGALFDALPTEGIDVSFVAILDPRPARSGFAPGPLGATGAVGNIKRHNLPLTDANVRGWIQSLAPTADPIDRYRALAILAQFSTRLGDTPEAKDLAGKINTALSKAFPDLSEQAQAWTLIFLPPTAEAAAATREIHGEAQRSESSLVRTVYVATQVTNPNGPEMNAALRVTTGRVAEFAEAHKTALLRAAQEAKEAAEAKAKAEEAKE